MFEILIGEYRRKQSMLVEAIENDLQAVVDELDSELSVLFETIITYDPETKSEFLTLCAFLLNHLSTVDSDSGVGSRVRATLLKLIDDNVAEFRAVAHG